MESEVRTVSVVYRPHECTVILGMAQAKSVANLMGCNNPQVGAMRLPLCPQLIFIKVHNAGLRSIGVG